MPDKLILRDGNFDGWQSRSASIHERGLKTIDEENRSVEAVVSTEDVAQVIDWSRWEIIDEILLSDGMQIPKNRQAPMLDNHSRYDSTSVKGSAREIKKGEGEITARMFFAKASANEWDLVREGHLTDVSVGYKVYHEHTVIVEPGEETTINGKTYKNSGTRTLAIRKKWDLKEVSLTPIGADVRAKFRSETANEPQGQTIECPECASRRATGGNIDEEKQNENNNQNREAVMPEENKAVEGMTPEQQKAEIHKQVERSLKAKENVEKRATLLGIENHRELTKDINFADEDAEQRAMDVLFAKAEESRKGEQVPPSQKNAGLGDVSVSADETDKFRSAAEDGLSLRASLHVEKPAEGAREFRGTTLVDLARECVERETGERIRDREEAVRAAITGTGSFPQVLSNVANKSMSTAYNAAPSTYQGWTRKGNLSDFKPETRLRLSEAEEPVEMTEHGEFKHAEVSELGQTIQLATFGRSFSMTRKAMINDDLGALTTIPQKYGAACRRLINRLVYAKVNGGLNATRTYDNQFLFHSDHKNIGSSAALAVASLGEARAKMRQQKNIGGKEALNIVPRYLLVPTPVETTAEQLISSLVDPTKANQTPNPFANKLQIICDAELDAASGGHDKAWFLAASPVEIDTVEVAFLNGNEMPTMESQESFDMLGLKWRIYIDFGISVLDWRGLLRNAGG